MIALRPTPRHGASAATCRAMRAALRAAFGLLALSAISPARAGDILRGGAPAGARGAPSAAAQNAGAADAARARANAKDILNRTNGALQSVQKMQKAARAAALAGPDNLGINPNFPGQTLSNVPDGLRVGGLEVAPGVGIDPALWRGAALPQERPDGGRTKVEIVQTQPQAVLNWKTFNVGKKTTVEFDQSAGGAQSGQWIAFNKISDPGGAPSQILGQIKADGQVYLINQNGIIFGGSSQINLRALTASALPINDNLIERGLLNNPDSQFLFSSLAMAGPTTKPFTPPPAPATPDGRIGNVTVQPGAQIAALVTADGSGGRVMLVGPSVSNRGEIQTPAGQTILAAGLQVGIDIAAGLKNTANPNTSLRGLDVFVGAVGDAARSYPAESVNEGVISAPRGSILLAGKRVLQLAVLEATTSVDINGRIDLLANFNATRNPSYVATNANSGAPFLFQATGLVELGERSATRVLPEYDSAKSFARTELNQRSQINLQGRTIHAGPEARIHAPSGAVALQAGTWILRGSGGNLRSDFTFADGQIYLDRGATLDVAGSTDVFVPLGQNILTVQFRGGQLANSPLQRDNLRVRAVDLTIDTRLTGTFGGRTFIGTPLGDASGLVNLIERNVAQQTTTGGDITLRAGNSIVLQNGARLDVSGGFTRNEGGRVQTTRLRRGATLIDIDEATPDRIYDSIFTGEIKERSAKWGVSRTFAQPLAPMGATAQPEYFAGADAGTIAITAPAMALDGELLGQRVIGPRQMRSTALTSSLPAAGTLNIAFEAQDGANPTGNFPLISPMPPTVYFQPGRQRSAPTFSLETNDVARGLPLDRQKAVTLSPSLFAENGFEKLVLINRDGNVVITSGTTLETPAGGTLEIAAANIAVDGNIVAPGGAVNLTAYNFSPYRAPLLVPGIDALPAADATRGTVTLAAARQISAAGLVLDDRVGGEERGTRPIVIAGGTVRIEAFDITLGEDSEIDVSGGVLHPASGRARYGNAGAITLLAGQNVTPSGPLSAPAVTAILGGKLTLDGALIGYSGARGGTLSLKAPLVAIGSASEAASNSLQLDPEFFSTGGFRAFTIAGIGGVDATGEFLPAVAIAPGTTLAPVVTSWISKTLGGENEGAPYFETTIKPMGLRDPVSLTFRAAGTTDAFSSNRILARGDIVFGAGAAIGTDPLGAVTFDGQTVALFGSVLAPGGAISIRGAGSFPEDAPSAVALPTVFLSSQVRLSTRGTLLSNPDAFGRERGSLLSGGSISVAGNIVGEFGAVLDVSGAAGVLDFTPAELGALASTLTPATSGLTSPLFALRSVPTVVYSDGGTITLAGSSLLASDAKLLGGPGGPDAHGGFLSISSGRYLPPNTVRSTTADINLRVTASGPVLGSGPRGIGQAVLGADGQTLVGIGLFAADRFAAGGFESLQLGGNVQFSGPVTIDAPGRLFFATSGIVSADAAVSLSAAYIRTGRPFLAPQRPDQQIVAFEQTDLGLISTFTPAPTSGTGSIVLRASQIDVGTTVMQGIGKTMLIAERGDIRGNGTLAVAGDLTMRAGQIYPTTGSAFNIFAYDPAGGRGSVTIEGSGVRPLPLSAGGSLTIAASVISQGGTLRAPLGGITLGWDGTGIAPTNPITTSAALPTPVTSLLTLTQGSITSISAIDPITGRGVLIPYGTSPDGLRWISPADVEVTTSGLLPEHLIKIGAQSLQMQSGSTLDLRGGGDLYAYRWIKGNGGTSDLLAAEDSFAILPDYGFDYAPFAPFNNTRSLAETNLRVSRDGDASGADSFRYDPGYVNTALDAPLGIGSQIYLSGSRSLDAGFYTLLPARYALLPGAVLVTPRTGAASPQGSLAITPAAQGTTEDGASIVSGYRVAGFSSDRDGSGKYDQFEIATPEVFRERAEYADYRANDFLSAAAADREIALQRLPRDSGRVILQATTAMTLAGNVLARPDRGGRGASADIAANADFWIGDGSIAAPAGTISLDAARLSSFEFESLLIGGLRTTDANGVTTLDVRTSNVRVAGASADLNSPEVILASRGTLTLDAGSRVASSGALTQAAATLRIVGDGALLRVSGDAAAATERTGTTNSVLPQLSIGAGAEVAGASLILDSTGGTALNPTARLIGQAIALNSGQITILLDAPGVIAPTAGLVLGGTALRTFEAAGRRSLLSYSSLDLYGTGTFGTPGAGDLVLRAGEIRGFNQAGGSVRLLGDTIILDNSPGGRVVSPEGAAPASGSLEFAGSTIRIGVNQIAINQFTTVTMNASNGLIGEGTGGFSTSSALTINAPRITTARSAVQTIAAGGALVLGNPTGAISTLRGGLGGTLSLRGSSVLAATELMLPSGALTLTATAGSLNVSGNLDTAGTTQNYFDVVRFTDGGQITLAATGGDVVLQNGSRVSVAAHPDGGNAGRLAISAPTGSFSAAGQIFGQAGTGGTAGAFTLDVSALPALSTISIPLNSAGFTGNRTIRVRTGDTLIDGSVEAREFSLAVDRGSIAVTGMIDAAGATGGNIALMANGSVTLAAGSRLDASGADFDSAGKGGAVRLEAGTERDGVKGVGQVDVQTGSEIVLTVESVVGATPAETATKTAAAALLGNFTGTLHVRAPQNAASTDLLVAPINGTITNASSVLIEGYQLFDLTATTGLITAGVQASVLANGQAFLGAEGVATAQAAAMRDRVLANNVALAPITVFAPGAEIIHRTGNLSLGTTSTTRTSDWDLEPFRFGERSAAGVLTLRARGDLVFFNTLSDGFDDGNNAVNLWIAPLKEQVNALPANLQSWSYRLTAGADLGASSSLATFPNATGSLLLGKNYGNASFVSGANATTANAIANGDRFQVLRTGSGNISIAAAGDVQLLNQFASIYTAGTRVADATTLFVPGDFSVPILNSPVTSAALGAQQQNYLAQYSLAGGNISIQAARDVVRYTRNTLAATGGQLIDDSSKQLPSNWLYRRGYVDETGVFGRAGASNTFGSQVADDPSASTTWWVDFSNFFEGVGTLGGGNIAIAAGRDVRNIDALAPTNARAPGGVPDAGSLVELGGGNVTITAGQDINGGVYYVERGRGVLEAGSAITTNRTRSPSLGLLPSVTSLNNPTVTDSEAWLGTTLFVGRGGFDVEARGNILLGPTANAFLLPAGLGNRFYYKTYFQTYGADSFVNVTSIGGDITHRLESNPNGSVAALPALQAWMASQNLLTTSSAANFYPWLRLAETSVTPFSTVFTVAAPTLRSSALSGSIRIAGDLNLFPSAQGTLELVANESIDGLNSVGVSTLLRPGQNTRVYTAARINLSDADPAALPGVTNPFSYQAQPFITFTAVNGLPAANSIGTTRDNFLSPINASFAETGSFTGSSAVVQAKQALHAAGPLHSGDPAPLRLYAGDGNISGLTLFSPKNAQVFAGENIEDIGLYIQNVDESDVSVVAAGKDITAYNSSTARRTLTTAPGNSLAQNESLLTGDIQISGPGALEVLAGRNLDLGTGQENVDGTGVGVTSIGNLRNPFLPFEGASVFVGSGLGNAFGLTDSEVDYRAFLEDYLGSTSGSKYAVELGKGITLTSLTPQQEAELALRVFFLVLRDAGRAESAAAVAMGESAGGYADGYAAIATFFGELGASGGDINTRSRDIRTKSGGDIYVFAPNGKLVLATSLVGAPTNPPGIVTEFGGRVSIFTDGDVEIGQARIFTLRGGDMVIWSSNGNIAAGAASKTVQTAPPNRVTIDPQSALVTIDLAGLATGGGIGVLNTVAGVEPGNVDLIAPSGFVDAGDAGIRASGNLTIAAPLVLNADNISAAGSSTGVPSAPTVAAPNLGALTTASNTAASTASATQQATNQNQPATEQEEAPSIIMVEVIGYGGS